MRKIIKDNVVLLLFFAAALIVTVVAIVSSRMMNDSAHMIEESTKQQLVALSRAAALLVTADEMDEYITPADMDKPGYVELKWRIIEFNNTSGLAYTYFLRLDTQTNMMQFVIDNIEEDYIGLAADQVDREPTPDIALSGTAAAVPLGSYSTGWDGYISSFAPVYYSDGTLSHVLAGVDMEDNYIKQAYDQNVLFSNILVCAVILVIAICLVCIMLYRRQARNSQTASISKSAFLSNMSHEMRTPMNAIIGMTEIAKFTDDQERIKYCLDKIDNAAGHLLGVINDILDISKIESGKFTLSPTEWAFDILMQRVANVVNFKVDEKHQTFAIKVDKDVPTSIITDQQRLAQVLTNLLSNAVKFTPDEGKISLQVCLIDQNDTCCTLQFAVQDNGIGIPKDKQANMFRSFEQADASISRRFGGTGLGLAISKSIIEAMKGTIWVESEEGQGSTFYFTIQVEKGLSSYVNRLAEGIDWKNVRLLLADESSETRQYFEDISAMIGVKCVTASSGYQVLELIDTGEVFDILFVDYMLPDVNGIELTRMIRERSDKNVIVIMLSVLDWEQIKDMALAAGVDRFIAKPLLPSPLVDCINGCMQHSQKRVELTFDNDSHLNVFTGRYILLAEDMEINSEIMAALLADTGITIDFAWDGRQAYEMFAAHPEKYDLIMMDINMPDMDGYEATRAIRNLHDVEKAGTIPIIAMTANVFREDIEKCLDFGMDDHIGKPVKLDEVINKLRKYL